MNSFSIIITAGGIGKRMGAEIPKQFIELNSLPILMHTINCFHSFDATCQIIVTLPSEWTQFWDQLIAKHQFSVPHIVVEGGIERYDSIKNALDLCTHTLIGVHDGVRPLVSHETIKRCLVLAKEKGAAIPVLPLKESLRQVIPKGSTAVERKEYLSVQTPQFFQSEIIEKAYKIQFHSGITDDASLVEEAGFVVYTTDGNEENVKITTPIDLKFARLFV